MMGFGNSVVGMGIAIKLHDMFSNTARTVSNSMKQLDDQGRALVRSGGMEIVGASLMRFGGAINGFFKDGISLAAEYEKSFSKVAVELEGYSAKDRKILDGTIDRLSTLYGLKKSLLAQGVVDIARQGVSKSSGISDILTASAMLSAATDMPVQKVSDHLGDMMMMFGKTSDAALGFADRVAYAANKSNVEVEDIFKSISYLGPAFRVAGATSEEALAIIAALGNAGIKSSRAGTSINQWLTQLANTMGEFRTKKQAYVFKKWGLSIEDVIDPVTGKAKNLVEIMSLLGSKALNGTLQGVADVNAVFNSRGGRALAAALANPIGKDINELYKGMIDTIDASGVVKKGDYFGFATKISDSVANSPQKRLERLEEAYNNFKQEIGKSFMGLIVAIAPALMYILDLMKALVSTPFGKVLIGLTAIAGVLAVVAGAVLMVGGAFLAWKTVFGGLGLSLLGTVTMGGRLLGILSKIAPFITLGRVASGVNPANGAFWFLNAGKFASWKSVFTGGWIARGISAVTTYIGSIGWLTRLFPSLASAATSAGGAMGTAASAPR